MQQLMPFMQDKNVFEIYINPDTKMWVDTFSDGRKYTGIKIPPHVSRQIIDNVAAITNQIVSDDMPILSAEIPDIGIFESARFQGVLPQIVSSPTINIRKHPKKIFSLSDYVSQGALTMEQKDIIIEAIKSKKNIIAAGATKSGKTTFLNALIGEISKLGDRVIMIEDTPELRCTAADYVSMRTTEKVSMDDCLRSVLRQTPDRIIVGEVRSGEALALLDAWSTGHSGGCSTVHSNSAADTLLRLENMTARVAKNPQQATIGQAVDMIIHLKYIAMKRKIDEIVVVKGYDRTKKQYILESVSTKKH
jgi:type IV secretion system protein VirB11